MQELLDMAKQLNTNAELVSKDFTKIVGRVVNIPLVGAQLADLQTDQFLEGIAGDGNKITPGYSDAYANFKGSTTVDYKLDGDFHSGVFVKGEANNIVWDSSDEKTAKLEKRTDNRILFGIAPQKEQKEVDIIDPDLAIEAGKTLFKGI